jgi:HK97 family phage prohead protease
MSDTALFSETLYKSIPGQINIDEAQGIVECFVAGIGNKDSVGDICATGSFTESLKRRKPRVVWGHNWNEPIGKVLDIYEVAPNDPRLPMKMKRAGIGGLYARVQFNLKSERGRQAFADVSFFGEEQEWSIGYKTLRADYDQSRQANVLKEVELYEVSPVLHGANQLTGTISIKTDEISAVKGHVEDYPRGEDGGIPAVNPMAGREQNLPKAIATRFGGAVRMRSADKNIAIFDHMKDGEMTTMRVSYHFDGDEFMFGDAVRVKPETVYLPVAQEENKPEQDEDDDKPETPFEEQYRDEIEENPVVPRDIQPKTGSCQCGGACGGEKVEELKAAPLDAIPQERFTGDVLRGYGPRRGNLEKLLRYWRPIMRKEGGFRRCRVILADHPELYPLNNICAWLHHETTGLWPNEGCHHPGMKNCRNKIKKGMNGTLWNDSEWNDRMSKLRSAGKSMEDGFMSADDNDDDYQKMGYEDWETKAVMELKTFVDQEPELVSYIGKDENWEHVGDDEDGNEFAHPLMSNGKPDDCGCGKKPMPTVAPSPEMGVMMALSALEKTVNQNIEQKAGRVISNRNMDKLRQAMKLLEDVVTAAAPTVEVKNDNSGVISAPLEELDAIKAHIQPIIEYHNIDASLVMDGIEFAFVSSEAKSALTKAMESFTYGINH